MADVYYQVHVGNVTKSYKEGTTYQEIAEDFQHMYGHRIVLVFVNNFRLQELTKTLMQDGQLEFITVADKIGHDTYKRSLCFLLVKAVHDVGGHDKVERVRIHFSVSKGVYCTVEGDVRVSEEFLGNVEKRMRKLVEEQIPIRKRSVNTNEAVKRFHEHKMYDKERLFSYRRVSKVNIYSINEFEDYYYGYMVPDTGYLQWFSLHLFEDGFVLQMPTIKEPEAVPPFEPQKKLFGVLKETIEWGDMQGIDTVGALNERVTKQNMLEAVLVEEAYQGRKIAEIAKKIAGKKDVKFILIAGPSSSGKTTFSHRLSIQLRVNGMIPHPIAVDNFYVDREKTPRDKDGNYDFECLEAVDIKEFNKDMRALLNGEEIYLPIFNFKTGKREYSHTPKRLGENDVLVIEGIHCLNPRLTADLRDENKFKIYISALTQLNIDEHNNLPTTDGRMIRRMVRDARNRNISARETIAMWDSVRRGEEQYIFPFQEEADIMFNSALIYELAVLKQYAEPLLFEIDKDCKEYTEAKRLLKFLDYFLPVPSEDIGRNSILREFIGGSCFNV